MPGSTSKPVPPQDRAQDEGRLVKQLRAGDQLAFAALVDELTPTMLRIARFHVATDAMAQDVIQDTWIGVLRGLPGFEGRASLRTWIFRILVNQAKARGVREQRVVPFASLADRETGEPFEAVRAERFRPAESERAPGHWASPLPRSESPADEVDAAQLRALVVAAMHELPVAQRTVMALRDLAGLESDEVSEALGISLGNQRVLLHRARSRVRAAVEAQLA